MVAPLAVIAAIPKVVAVGKATAPLWRPLVGLGVAAVIAAGTLGFVVSSGSSSSAGAMLLASQGAPASQAGCSGQPGAAAPATAPVAGDAGAVVAAAASAAGWRGDNLQIAVAVSMAESGHNPLATNMNTNGSVDHGLWQINSIHGALLQRGDWRDPEDNARMAYQVWSDAGGWTPWVTYNEGLHERHMAAAAVIVSGVAAPAICTPAAVAGEVDPSAFDPGDGPMSPPSGGLRPRAQNVRAITLATWGCDVAPQPCISTVGGYSYRYIGGTTTLSDHATGRAADIMVPDYRGDGRAVGDAIAAYFVANASQLGLKYVIWYDRIWKPSDGWTSYGHPSGGGGDTVQHRDHVHVSTL